jgi:hypothetical protein
MCASYVTDMYYVALRTSVMWTEIWRSLPILLMEIKDGLAQRAAFVQLQ